MEIKISPPTHPYTNMTEDFLVRQAAAELLLIEQASSHSPDTATALKTSLWNWFSEYGKYAAPAQLVKMSSPVGDFLSAKAADIENSLSLAKLIVSSSQK